MAQTETARLSDRTGPIQTSFIIRVFYVFAALALVSVGISAFGKWAGRAIALAGHTEDRTVYRIAIGDNLLELPANAIRFGHARRDGAPARLDLYLRWPDMAGYTAATSDDFNHAGGRRNILFLTFDQRIMSQDMSGRLEPIYSSLIEKRGELGPNGLVVYPFLESSGYADEVLIVGERPGVPPFVARCLSGVAARNSLAPCERDVHIGRDLNLVYRFPAELAGQWRELDAAVVTTAQGYLKASRTP